VSEKFHFVSHALRVRDQAHHLIIISFKTLFVICDKRQASSVKRPSSIVKQASIVNATLRTEKVDDEQRSFSHEGPVMTQWGTMRTYSLLGTPLPIFPNPHPSMDLSQKRSSRNAQ
jgi:hypothetical protein